MLSFAEVKEDQSILDDPGALKLICDCCGHLFLRPKSEVRKSIKRKKKNAFCSKECSDKGSKVFSLFEIKRNPNALEGVVRVKLSCAGCDSEFLRIRNKVKRSVSEGVKNLYCTRECLQKSLQKSVEVPCNNCRMLFDVKPCKLKDGRNFCSKKCTTRFNSKKNMLSMFAKVFEMDIVL
jgi:hypothetical protein